MLDDDLEEDETEEELEEERSIDGQTLKSLKFHIPTKKYLELYVQLKLDGIKRNVFFAACIESYIKKDPSMIKILNDLRKSEREAIYAKRQSQKATTTKKQFALDDDELENIFDLIEEDHPEL